MTEEVPEQAELQGEEAQEGVQEVPQEGLEYAGEEPPVGEGYEGTGEEAPLQEEEAAGQEGNVEGAEYAAEEDAGLIAGGPEEGGEYPVEEGQPQDDYAGGEEEQPQEEQVNDPEAENQAEASPFVDSQLARRFNRNPYYGQFCAGLHNLISYDLKIAGTPAQETIQYLNELMAVLATDMWAADDRASVSMPKVDGKRMSNPNNPFKSFSHAQSNQESLSMVYST